MFYRNCLLALLIMPIVASAALDAAWVWFSFRAGAWLSDFPRETWWTLNPLYLAAAWLVWRDGQ